MPRKANSSDEQEGANRGVRMGFTRVKRLLSSSQRRVSFLLSSVVSHRYGGAFRSMFTLPTYPVTPAFSNSSMRIRVLSVCREENMATLVVPF